MVNEAIEAKKLLAEQGISAEIINVHTIKPLDKETVLRSAAKTGAANPSGSRPPLNESSIAADVSIA